MAFKVNCAFYSSSLTVGRLRSEVDLDVRVEVDVGEGLHLNVGHGRLREPRDEAGDDEQRGDLGRVAEAVVGQAGIGARVPAPDGGDPQGTLQPRLITVTIDPTCKVHGSQGTWTSGRDGNSNHPKLVMSLMTGI